jgi:hypothetical protein
VFAQTAAPPPPPLFQAPAPPVAAGARTLADVICDPSLSLGSGFLCDALTATGLLALLATPGPFTVFVPTCACADVARGVRVRVACAAFAELLRLLCLVFRNAAWYAALVRLGVTKEELWEDPSLTEVVANHVVRGMLPCKSLFYGQTLPTLHRSAPNVARELRTAAANGVVRAAARKHAPYAAHQRARAGHKPGVRSALLGFASRGACVRVTLLRQQPRQQLIYTMRRCTRTRCSSTSLWRAAK